MTPLVFSNLRSLCSLSFFWCTPSDYSLGIFKTLIVVLFVLFLMYGFWLLLWYFQTLDHCVVCPSFDVRLLITHLVFSNLWSLCCVSFFWCTPSDYSLGIFKPLIVVLFVLLLMYGFWLLLWYFQTLDHCVVCPSFGARHLITPLVFSNLWSLCCLSFFWCTASDYSFDIFKPLVIVLFVFLFMHGYWLLL